MLLPKVLRARLTMRGTGLCLLRGQVWSLLAVYTPFLLHCAQGDLNPALLAPLTTQPVFPTVFCGPVRLSGCRRTFQVVGVR